MKLYRIAAVVSAACLLLTGCGRESSSTAESSTAAGTTEITASETTAALTTTESTQTTTETETAAADETKPDPTGTAAEPVKTVSDNVPQERIEGKLFDTPEEAFANTFEAINREDGLMLYYAMPKALRENLLAEQDLTEEEILPVLVKSLSGADITIEYEIRSKKTPEEAFPDDKHKIESLKLELENLERDMPGETLDCVVLDVHVKMTTGSRTDEEDEQQAVCHCKDGWFDYAGCMLISMLIGEAGDDSLLDDKPDSTSEREEQNP